MSHATDEEAKRDQTSIVACNGRFMLSPGLPPGLLPPGYHQYVLSPQFLPANIPAQDKSSKPGKPGKPDKPDDESANLEIVSEVNHPVGNTVTMTAVMNMFMALMAALMSLITALKSQPQPAQTPKPRQKTRVVRLDDESPKKGPRVSRGKSADRCPSDKTECKYGKNCKFGVFNCEFWHPKPVDCKYGEKCRNFRKGGCRYWHKKEHFQSCSKCQKPQGKGRGGGKGSGK